MFRGGTGKFLELGTRGNRTLEGHWAQDTYDFAFKRVRTTSKPVAPAASSLIKGDAVRSLCRFDDNMV